ncbi:hypothetical protein HDU83_001048 [Entophlyctis luteolus]|nr:hypothetical protein HDU83_001048 [Entophlyctis luteolus]
MCGKDVAGGKSSLVCTDHVVAAFQHASIGKEIRTAIAVRVSGCAKLGAQGAIGCVVQSVAHFWVELELEMRAPPPYADPLPPYPDEKNASHNSSNFAHPSTPAPAIIVSGGGGALVPVYSADGKTAEVVVQSHKLPPRLTRQYAVEGFPGAATQAILTSQDNSAVYSTRNVPLAEAVALNMYGNGTVVEEPYNTNSSYYWPLSGFRSNRGVLIATEPPRKYRWWSSNGGN